jgi:hypothetical protein
MSNYGFIPGTSLSNQALYWPRVSYFFFFVLLPSSCLRSAGLLDGVAGARGQLADRRIAAKISG